VPGLSQLLDDLRQAGFWFVVLQILLIVGATGVALIFARATVNVGLGRLFAREVAEGTAQDVPQIEVQRRRQTLEGLVYRAVRILILIIAFLMTLQVLRLDIGPAIAGLGIVGLALSLGAQHLVRDYVAGAFVLIENQYSKGDLVTIAGVTGTVEDVSLRRTTLRDFDGTLHYVPHGLIQTASNLSRTWAAVNLDVPVPYEQDLDAVSAAVDAAAGKLADEPELRGAVLETPRVVRVERLSEPGLVLKIFGRVTPTARYAAAGSLRRLIISEAARRGIVVGWRPVPTPSDGAAPTTERGAEAAAAARQIEGRDPDSLASSAE
jgi:moderate conductance mechanosensitive channel